MAAPSIDTGTIICGDSLEKVAALPPASVDLIYLDPPFFSNRHYEVIWGDEAEIRSFEDRWQGGINAYVEWMRERVMELSRVLKRSGTIYLHCDPHASHYLKIMMDEVFGRRNFLNEIIWHYQTSSGSPKKWLHRNHDTILRYAASRPSLVTWNHPREPWPESTLRKWQRDEEGRIYRIQNKYAKRYYIDPRGKLADDVWEITLSARTKERLGYPTQKPEALLERIIEASSNRGDVVLDPFCGCGTTLAAAQKLEREWIGIDISPTACQLMQRRMRRLSVEPKMRDMPVTDEALRALKPFEFQNLVIDRMNGTHAPRRTGDLGVDGFTWFEHLPIQVKQSERVGREVVDQFETAIERSGKQGGNIVAFSFTRGAYEEVARVKRSRGFEITLQRAADLFKQPLPAPQREVLPARPAVLPSAEQLVASERGADLELIEAERRREEYARRVAEEAAEFEVPLSPATPRSPRKSTRGR